MDECSISLQYTFCDKNKYFIWKDEWLQLVYGEIKLP